MTIFNHHLLPPAGASKISFNGRTYDPAAGAQDVPEGDAAHLEANGWIFLAMSGPTTARPTSALGTHPLVSGTKFWDTTISHMVMWDGKNWRNEGGAIS
jgi:hypothetical protein